MALPSHLWLPDGVELPPLPPGAPPPSSASPTAPTLAAPAAPVVRRRAVLRGEGALPDRPVLVEWLRGPGRDAWLAEARARLGACHANLLRPLRVGLSDPLTGYVVSEQPEGVDLLTALRAARGQAQPDLRAPPWFVASVLHEAGRGLLALQRHLGGRAGLHPASVFIDWQGDVRLLAFAALPVDLTASEAGGATGVGMLAPELRLAPRLAGAAADVYTLAHLLAELLPAAGASTPVTPLGRLRAVLERGRAGRPEDRPPLSELLDGLGAYLLAEAPLQRRAARGAQLARLCPPESAGDLGALDLLGAWEDVWGAPSLALAEAPAPRAAAAAAPRSTSAPRPAVAPPPRPAAGRAALYLGAAALGAAGLYFTLQALLR